MKDYEKYIDKIKNWYKNENQRIFIISGYAGCGKTTLAKKISKELNLYSVVYLAPTGKAATVLGGRAQTIHSYIYTAHIDEYTKKLYFVKKMKEDFDDSLIVVDEISMVNQELLADLRELEIPIIGLGDPAQLPPVKGKSEILEKPDILLTHVFRNDGGILDLSTDIRKGNTLKEFYKNVNFKKDIYKDMENMKDDFIVISRYNKTRQKLNHYIRENIYGYQDLVEVGEKLIILRNDRDSGLSNGSIVTVLEILPSHSMEDPRERIMHLIIDNNGIKQPLTINAKTMLGEMKGRWDRGLDVDYAYVITCHKSQGSEFDTVYVIKEGQHFDDFHKWFYTAVTRAKKELFIYEDALEDL